MQKAKVAVCISGSGSNLQALMDAAAKPDFPAEIILVISNKSDAYGLERAAKMNVATRVLSHKDYEDRAAYDAALDAALKEAGAEYVCLAGFMRLLTPEFVQAWAGKMINIHPSLLPEFAGLDTHQRAIEAGKKEAGCTVHFVTPVMDAGPQIAQARVPIHAEDTPETLAARVLKQEHAIYPQALEDLVTGKLAALAEQAVIQAKSESA